MKKTITRAAYKVVLWAVLAARFCNSAAWLVIGLLELLAHLIDSFYYSRVIELEDKIRGLDDVDL